MTKLTWEELSTEEMTIFLARLDKKIAKMRLRLALQIIGVVVAISISAAIAIFLISNFG